MDIVICCSVDFTYKIKEIKEELEKRGHSVKIPFFTGKILSGEVSYKEYMNTKIGGGDINLRRKSGEDLILRYYNFIKNCDVILVLNIGKKGIPNYIGGNTFLEMGFAYVSGKKIYLYNPIPEMGYSDEIKDMKPIVIDRDLDKIIL
jgi:hypothetical protein